MSAQSELDQFIEGVEMCTWFLSKNGYKWNFESQDSILKINFTGKFEFHPLLGTENLDGRNIKSIDTLTILFRIGPYFSKGKIDSIRTNNKLLLDSISSTLIEEYEKNGYPFKLAKYQIEEDPLRYAESKINQELINQVVRLPDMRFESFSVYVDFSIDTKQIFIHPPEAQQLVKDFIIRVFTMNREFLHGVDNVKNY